MQPDFGTQRERPLQILDFDIENRPLAYWYDDKTTPEITAIAWSWQGSLAPIEVATLEPPPHHGTSARTMLRRFRDAYNKADIVTGHFIRGHDLPIVNAAMIEYGFPPLAPKLVSDTNRDLIRYGGQSKSQMALANVLGVEAEKPRMTVNRWRDANRLTTEGVEATINRVVGDVAQHKELRRALIAAGMLKTPRMWRP